MKTQKFWQGWGVFVVMTVLFLSVSCSGGAGGPTIGDNDGLSDTDTKEQLRNQDGKLCRDLTDCDGDGVIDHEDLDINGNNLIEIQTQEELAAIHYVLNGTGRRFSEAEAVNVLGCGDSCRGYELVNDIPLSYDNASGWQPLGGNASLTAFDRGSKDGATILGKDEGGQPYCKSGPKEGRNGTGEAKGFDGVFEGNGWTISNLTINLPAHHCVGLFAKARGEIRNLYVEADRIIGNKLVGVVVGDGSYATIRNVHARTRWLSGEGNSTIGGLVGSIYWGSLVDSSAITDSLIGYDTQTGGLVGAAIFSNISDSAAMITNLTGGTTTPHGRNRALAIAMGGLVGYCGESVIDSSFSITERIESLSPTRENEHKAGGLAGQCAGSPIRDSYALAGTIEGKDRNGNTGGNNIGGLVGQLSGAKETKGPQVMINSYAITESIGGRDRVGGLNGGGEVALSSFAITANLVSSGSVGGLRGGAAGGTVWNSYAISGTIHSKSNEVAGGLVADASSITASYGIVHTMQSPRTRHGGLVGRLNPNERVLSSYAMMANVNDSSALGGLVGLVSSRGTSQADIIASYGVGNLSSPNLGSGLIGTFAASGSQEDEVNIVSSYWDNLTDSPAVAVLRNGSLATIWTNGTEEGLNDRAVWCDLNQNERIDMDEKRPDNRIWDFGVSMRAEYPIIRCTPSNPLGLNQDRWRRLKDGKPNIPDSAELKRLISAFRAEQRALFPQHIADQQ